MKSSPRKPDHLMLQEIIEQKNDTSPVKERKEEEEEEEVFTEL